MKFKMGKRSLIACIVVLVTAAVVTYLLLGQHQQFNDGTKAITYSTDTPDETKPGKDYHWQGAGNDPKRIIMPSIGVDGYIQNVGVDQHQQVSVPNNVHMAGWFVNSVRPGQKGLSIIDGHVDGRSGNAIFYRLHEAKEGDEFNVQFGDGSEKRFRVIKISTVATEDAASILFSQNPVVTSQLNLITCIGQYDSHTRQYDQRVIVQSENIN